MKIAKGCALGLGMAAGAPLAPHLHLTLGTCRALLPVVLATLAGLLTWRPRV